ncbi:MAG: carboxypeptidase regulatory-like domain-containing protein [Rhodothermales bacterium]
MRLKTPYYFPILLVFVLSLVIPDQVFAQSGKLSGVVTDAVSGDPIPGATVIIDGTTQGTATDTEGRYDILNVSPGTYSLRFSFVGFTTRLIENVLVTSGRTTTLNTTMGTEVVETGEIVIAAERPVVDVNQTTSRAIVTGEELSRLPVATLNDAISRTSNSYEGFIRGSRRYETKTILDGIDVSDAFNPIAPNANSTSSNPLGSRQIPFAGAIYDNTNRHHQANGGLFSINPEAVSEVTVNTGAMESRYAAASGGVVTVALSEGKGPITGTASFRYTPSIIRPGPDSLNYYEDGASYLAERDTKVAEGATSAELFTWTPDKYGVSEDPEVDARFSLSGSITDKWSFFAAGQWFQTSGFQPNVFRKRLSGQLKTSYDLGENTRLSLLGIVEDNGLWGNWNNRSYMDYWRFYLEGVAQDDAGSYLGSIKLTQVLSDHSYLEFQVYNTYKRTRYGYVDDDGDGFTQLGEDGDFIDFTDPANIMKYIGTGADNSKMFYENISNSFSHTQIQLPDGSNYKAARPQPYSEDATQTNTGIKLDYANQISSNHFIQLGTELKSRTFEYDQVYGVDQTGAKLNGALEPFIPQSWERNPWELGIYASDRMEYAGLIVNLGLRVEFIDRNMEKINDIFYPFRRDSVTVTSNIDPGMAPVKLARNNFDRGESVPTDFFLIPSIGVSHPIGTTGAMYFSYARTKQLLPYTTLYQFYDGNSSNNRFFNYQDPEQDPITSDNYEVGVQWEFAEGWGADINAYMRAIQNYNQTTLTASRAADPDGPPVLVNTLHTYATSFGYADARGIELVLRRRALSIAKDVTLGITASYTFSAVEQAIATGENTRDFADQGNGSEIPFDDAEDYQNFPQNVAGGSSTLTGGYDRSHRFVLRSVSSLPYNISIGLTGSLESGFLYPPVVEADPRDRALLTGPTNYKFDLRFEKRFAFEGRYGVDLYVDITNLTNRQNVIAYERATIDTQRNFELNGIPGPRLISRDGTSLFGPARTVYFGARLRF